MQSYSQVGGIKKEVKKDKEKREKKKAQKKVSSQNYMPNTGATNTTNTATTNTTTTEKEKRNWFFKSNKDAETSKSIDVVKHYDTTDTAISTFSNQAYNPYTDKSRNSHDTPNLVIKEKVYPAWANFSEFGYNIGWGSQSNAKMDMGTITFGKKYLSTEFRLQNITDTTGRLGLFDWQVLKLNFYSENIRLAMGGGFVYVIDPSLAYFEWSMLFEGYLIEKLMKLSMEYRDATRIEAPSFRREISVFVDYDLTPKWKAHFSPMAGVRYQNYFGDFHQWFFEVGMIVRVF